MVHFPSAVRLDAREQQELFLLATGALVPTAGPEPSAWSGRTYMDADAYAACVRGEHECSLPLVLRCSGPGHTSSRPETVGAIVLKASDGTRLGELKRARAFPMVLGPELDQVYQTRDRAHPYVRYLADRLCNGDVDALASAENVWGLFGDLDLIPNAKAALRGFFGLPATLSPTPAEWKAQLADRVEAGRPVLGFQTRNPTHRCHVELMRASAEATERDCGRKPVVCLQPALGDTQPGDVPWAVRMHCYRAVLPYLREMGVDVYLCPLVLPMRMAGPREALFHALVRRNYGCTHFVVGRDHAGPSRRHSETGRPFYGPYDAQLAVKAAQTRLGVTAVVSPELVYVPDEDAYRPRTEVAGGTPTASLSGSALRAKLAAGEDLPGWFTYPAIETVLRRHYGAYRSPTDARGGVCVYIVGLSGSGKSTLARAIQSHVVAADPFRAVTMLDGDVVRTHISKGLGLSEADRSTNVRRIGFVAAEVARHGGLVLAANIAPFEEDRAFNRRAVEAVGGTYVEVYMHASADVCAQRDAKGLYALARQGKLGAPLTGYDTATEARFEAPEQAEVAVYPDENVDVVAAQIAETFCGLTT